MKLESVPLHELTEDPRNARTHDERNMAAIKASLARFGQVEPLVVREETGVVVGGNGRLAAMREMGWAEASIVRVPLTDAKATALGIALNRTADLAGWNEERLADLIADIARDGFELPAVDELDLGSLVDDALIFGAMGAGPAPDFAPNDGADQDRLDQKKAVTCPNCATEFVPR